MKAGNSPRIQQVQTLLEREFLTDHYKTKCDYIFEPSFQCLEYMDIDRNKYKISTRHKERG